ncbi:hypothetical protein UPYG_G00344680 [Umbra pygmaea]|uniref:Uncharacterized protein n=1 Tax=Umbra pygmaea TaxID=75934 RepID=A0ABD0W1I2_UMBPY
MGNLKKHQHNSVVLGRDKGTRSGDVYQVSPGGNVITNSSDVGTSTERTALYNRRTGGIVRLLKNFLHHSTVEGVRLAHREDAEKRVLTALQTAGQTPVYRYQSDPGEID